MDAAASVRGRVTHETIGRREALVINEIPYQVVQNNLIEKMVEAAKNGRIDGIADIKNLSGKSHRTRIVVYLKKNADPDVVEKQIYRHTPLQTTFSIINIALDRNRPRTLGIKPLIRCYINMTTSFAAAPSTSFAKLASRPIDSRD